MLTKKNSDAKPTVKPDNPVEKEPAVEWGERLSTSKDIARGGKSSGFVLGATEQPTDADTKPNGEAAKKSR